jgi:hypothetical protein
MSKSVRHSLKLPKDCLSQQLTNPELVSIPASQTSSTERVALTNVAGIKSFPKPTDSLF